MSICYHNSQTQFLPSIFFFQSKRNKDNKEYEYAIQRLDSYFPPTSAPECGPMSATSNIIMLESIDFIEKTRWGFALCSWEYVKKVLFECWISDKATADADHASQNILIVLHAG